ncbi:hypothetical protein [Acinetobacter sp. ULE_I037]|uniref:hypothetical protein n=1 Tax=unclassified Acinetobacter TaxID=196816 RepID=UPI003AF86593
MEIENIVAIKEPSRSSSASVLDTKRTPSKPRLVDQKVIAQLVKRKYGYQHAVWVDGDLLLLNSVEDIQ